MKKNDELVRRQRRKIFEERTFDKTFYLGRLKLEVFSRSLKKNQKKIDDELVDKGGRYSRCGKNIWSYVERNVERRLG